MNQKVEEMDKLEVIKIDAQNINYPAELVSVFRSVADPFGNQLSELKYEPNPNDMTELTKNIEFASGQADDLSTDMWSVSWSGVMAEWFTMVLITSDAAEKGSFFIAILLIISVKITVIKSGKS